MRKYYKTIPTKAEACNNGDNVLDINTVKAFIEEAISNGATHVRFHGSEYGDYAALDACVEAEEKEIDAFLRKNYLEQVQKLNFHHYDDDVNSFSLLSNMLTKNFPPNDDVVKWYDEGRINKDDDNEEN